MNFLTYKYINSKPNKLLSFKWNIKKQKGHNHLQKIIFLFTNNGLYGSFSG